MRPILLAAALVLPLLEGCTSTRSNDASAGWRQIEMRDYRAALGTFDKELEGAPSADLHAGRARALFFLGKLDEAASGFAAALEIDPREPDWHLGLGIVRMAQGDLLAATAAFDAALEIDPRHAKAYYNRGCARLGIQDYDAAMDDFTRTIRFDGNHAAAYNGRGIARSRTGRLDQAIDDFQRAAALAPSASAHGNCAAAYYAKGQAQLALTELNIAIKLERANPVYYTNRGRIYLDLAQADLAARDFEQALALAPNTGAIRALLADARALLGSPAAPAPSQPPRSAAFGN